MTFTLLSALAGVSTFTHPQTLSSRSLVSGSRLRLSPATPSSSARQLRRSFLHFQAVDLETSQPPRACELLPRHSLSSILAGPRPDKHRDQTLKEWIHALWKAQPSQLRSPFRKYSPAYVERPLSQLAEMIVALRFAALWICWPTVKVHPFVMNSH